jgi:hypothetical protein
MDIRTFQMNIADGGAAVAENSLLKMAAIWFLLSAKLFLNR